MSTLRIGEVELNYVDVGIGTPIVFLHGLGSRLEDWQFQLEHFSKDFRCLAFDLPGSGKSVDHAHPYGPFSLPGYARDIAAALRELKLERVHLVGLSMGAMTSLQLALDAPELFRSVTMANAVASMEPRNFKERLLLGVRGLITYTLGPKGIGKVVAPKLFPSAEQESLREQFRAHLATVNKRIYIAQSRALMGWTVEPRLGELKVPLTLIAADGDYTSLERKHALAARVPGAKVIVIPNTHHAVPVENPTAFNAALRASVLTERQ
ncbi:MAG: alpha/beta fold hydrolase [Archangium sp.]